MKEVEIGTKFTDEGWIDVEKISVVPEARFEHLVGIIVDETGAGNIGNIDKFLEYVNGHRIKISIEVIDVAENRPEITKVPPPTPIEYVNEYGIEYCAKCGKIIR